MENGYMSGVRIATELKKMGYDNAEEIIKALKTEPTIHRITYTNRFIDKYCTRDLYYYNPKKKRKLRGKEKVLPG